MPLSSATHKWLEHELNVTIKKAEPLLGGTSSLMWLVKVGDDKQVVVREYTDEEWLALEPEIARQEAENLRAAETLTIHTPKRLAADPYGEVTTHPTVVMSHVPGKVVLDPQNQSDWLDALAQTLAQLHKNKAVVKHKYFRYFDPKTEVKAAWSRHPKLWQRAFAYLVNTPQPESAAAFIHRDFHPTNVLFQGTTVSAVIDWPNACMGPRAFDVAHCRWNLAMLEGVEAADAFLKAYLEYSDVKSYDPYWDLEALLNVFSEETPDVYAGWKAFGRKDLTAKIMRDRMDDFLAQALAML